MKNQTDIIKQIDTALNENRHALMADYFNHPTQKTIVNQVEDNEPERRDNILHSYICIIDDCYAESEEPHDFCETCKTALQKNETPTPQPCTNELIQQHLEDEPCFFCSIIDNTQNYTENSARETRRLAENIQTQAIRLSVMGLALPDTVIQAIRRDVRNARNRNL